MENESVQRFTGKKGYVAKDVRSAMVPIALFCIVLLIQGGFYNAATSFCGIVVSIIGAIACFAKGGRKDRLPVTVVLLFGIALAYLVSMCVNGITVTTLSETGTWFAVAAFGLYASCQSSNARAMSFRAFECLGVISAVFGALVYLGVFDIYGTMDDGRLQFFFQYANAAGVWFACISLGCFLSGDCKLNSCVPVLIFAMLVTKSGGAILCFGVVAACIAVFLCRRGSYQELLRFLCQGTLSVVVFLLVELTSGMLSVLLFVALCAACVVCIARGNVVKPSYLFAKHMSIALFALLLFALCVVVALLGVRVFDAWNHLIERVYFVFDALALWGSEPLFGIGPDNWQYAYPYVQTAQYHTTVVHNSFVQVGVDAGIFAVACLVAFFVLGAIDCVKKWRDGDGAAAVALIAMLAIHCLFDFDLQFGALALFASFLVCAPDGPSIRVQKLWAGVISLVVCLPLCAVGVLADFSKSAVYMANESGDYWEAELLSRGNSIVNDDVSMQTQYLLACYGAYDYGKVEFFYKTYGTSSDEQAVYVALSCFALGDSAEASEALVSEMEKQPWNPELIESARTVFDTYPIDESVRQRYNAAIEHSNSLAENAPAILPAQRVVDAYL